MAYDIAVHYLRIVGVGALNFPGVGLQQWATALEAAARPIGYK